MQHDFIELTVEQLGWTVGGADGDGPEDDGGDRPPPRESSREGGSRQASSGKGGLDVGSIGKMLGGLGGSGGGKSNPLGQIMQFAKLAMPMLGAIG
jgi:hypothetical protein